MATSRQEIEAFVRRIVAEIAAAEAAGATAAQAIANHLNAEGITTRKGRRWTGPGVAKFLASPGAKRLGAEY
ncbi:MAG: recombinase family protein [Rhodospirillales bacterium]|jgi:adenine/guanine phosphoribosyltransferase-like PRPP-binding protein|nr:recombinase family protein [Rhodospirillales bacterium]MDP6805753.1 recombinase family protein [Rhodospirillales bacterium]